MTGAEAVGRFVTALLGVVLFAGGSYLLARLRLLEDALPTVGLLLVALAGLALVLLAFSGIQLVADDDTDDTDEGGGEES